MAKGKVILELELNEYEVVKNALENYKGRLIHLIKQNDMHYMELQKLNKQEKTLDKILSDFNIE